MSFCKPLRPLALLPCIIVSGCDLLVLHPFGAIAKHQSHLILVSTVLMLLIVVPVIALTLLFAWRYRAGNAQAIYRPDWDHSTALELLIWSAPLLIVIALGAITWINTHTLDPYRPLGAADSKSAGSADSKSAGSADSKSAGSAGSKAAGPAVANPAVTSGPAAAPLVVEVVALDWKWLFIYPDQGIATVNELVAPVDVPIHFKITSSSVMNSFFIPALAGQIYAMPGMQTELNAIINQVGIYDGFSANYSGAGFSGMRFKFHGMTRGEFQQWVLRTRDSAAALDSARYLELARPSERNPVQRYSSVAGGLYDAILNQCVQAPSC
jgi:cytochrome o ubiquinol oxidase subunit 2